ncbi:MAG: NAD(P)H-binding protein [Nannocystaceae bacterium]
MSPPVAFVAGATGYTGREVVATACARGIVTHAHVRPDSPNFEATRLRLSALGATVEPLPWTLGAMTEAMARIRPTQLYYLIGTTKARARAAARAGAAPADYASVDVGLALLLVDACKAVGIRPRFVYLSSLGAGPGARGAYLQARAQVEAALAESGLPYTVVRPSFITGPDREEDRIGERVGAAISDRVLSLVGALGGRQTQQRYRSTDAATLARALVRLAGDPAAEGKVILSEDLHEP